MTGSNFGSSPKVLAKQPFSVVYTWPPGISAMKSSWAGLLPSWVVKVVVVLPVPDPFRRFPRDWTGPFLAFCAISGGACRALVADLLDVPQGRTQPGQPGV